MGEWYYPNGTVISADSARGLYVIREQKSVSLNYRSGAVPAGLYCCVVPTSQGTQVSCAIFGECFFFPPEPNNLYTIFNIPDSEQPSSSISFPRSTDIAGPVVGCVVAVIVVLLIIVGVVITTYLVLHETQESGSNVRECVTHVSEYSTVQVFSLKV